MEEEEKKKPNQKHPTEKKNMVQYSGNNFLALVHNKKLLKVDIQYYSPEIHTVILFKMQ